MTFTDIEGGGSGVMKQRLVPDFSIYFTNIINSVSHTNKVMGTFFRITILAPRMFY